MSEAKSVFEENEAAVREDIRQRDGNGRIMRAFDELVDLSEPSEELREALTAAEEVGRQRGPKAHQIVVHGDWLRRQSDISFVGRCLDALPKTNYIAVLAETDHDQGAMVSVRTPRVAVTHSFTNSQTGQVITIRGGSEMAGFLKEDSWIEILRTTEGIHPNDTFLVHGGEWHACQAHFTSQLLGVLMGKMLPPNIASSKRLETILTTGFVRTDGPKGEEKPLLGTSYGESLDGEMNYLKTDLWKRLAGRMVGPNTKLHTHNGVINLYR